MEPPSPRFFPSLDDLLNLHTPPQCVATTKNKIKRCSRKWKRDGFSESVEILLTLDLSSATSREHLLHVAELLLCRRSHLQHCSSALVDHWIEDFEAGCGTIWSERRADALYRHTERQATNNVHDDEKSRSDSAFSGLAETSTSITKRMLCSPTTPRVSNQCPRFPRANEIPASEEYSPYRKREHNALVYEIKRPLTKEQKAGYAYWFVYDESDNIWKIGHSKQPEARVKQQMNMRRLEFLEQNWGKTEHEASNCRRLEQIIHALLHQHRVQGLITRGRELFRAGTDGHHKDLFLKAFEVADKFFHEGNPYDTSTKKLRQVWEDNISKLAIKSSDSTSDIICKFEAWIDMVIAMTPIQSTDSSLSSPLSSTTPSALPSTPPPTAPLTVPITASSAPPSPPPTPSPSVPSSASPFTPFSASLSTPPASPPTPPSLLSTPPSLSTTIDIALNKTIRSIRLSFSPRPDTPSPGATNETTPVGVHVNIHVLPISA